MRDGKKKNKRIIAAVLVILILVIFMILIIARNITTDTKVPAETKLDDDLKFTGDMIAWISIPESNIDYPVMQTVDDPDFYLSHDFDGKYSAYGTPYLDFRCSLSSENLIIYGHNIRGRRMFGELLYYETYDYMNSHRKIILFTENGKSTYHVEAIMCVPGNSEWYGFINTNSRSEFEKRFNWAKNNSIYDCGNKSKKNTAQLLTLSTCDESGDDGRFLVIASKKDS